MKILLVDDDTQVTELIRQQLKKSNYTVEVAPDGEYAMDLLYANPYSLVLLDVMLPTLSGLEVCKTLRNQGDRTPVLMLTGQDSTQDRVKGLDAGADDYLVKPFELDELTARVRSLLRRSSENTSSTLLQYGGLVFDPTSQALSYQGHPIALRPKEMAILELLLRYPTQVFDADILLERLWNLADCPGKATIKTHIRSLRKQLDEAGVQDLVETLYGRGYRLNPAFPGQLEPERVVQSDSVSTCQIINDTWEQVQGISWRRLMRLRSLVRSLPSHDPATSADSAAVSLNASTHPPQEAIVQEAVKVAHQLKGSLGSFGFRSASLQAEHVERLFDQASGGMALDLEIMQIHVNVLEQLLKKQITKRHIWDVNLSQTESSPTVTSQALIVSRDRAWRQNLQNLHRLSQDTSFFVKACSPLEINRYLLAQTPVLIALDLSEAERETDSSLLQVLLSNYGEQVQIVAITESYLRDIRLHALQQGATACIPKICSSHTILSMIGDMIRPINDHVCSQSEQSLVD